MIADDHEDDKEVELTDGMLEEALGEDTEDEEEEDDPLMMDEFGGGGDGEEKWE